MIWFIVPHDRKINLEPLLVSVSMYLIDLNFIITRHLHFVHTVALFCGAFIDKGSNAKVKTLISGCGLCSFIACGINVHQRCQSFVACSCGIDQVELSKIMSSMGVSPDQINPVTMAILIRLLSYCLLET